MKYSLSLCHPNLLFSVVSVTSSLVGMAISFVAYQRALRNTLKEKKQLSILATIVLLLFRFLTILSRVSGELGDS